MVHVQPRESGDGLADAERVKKHTMKKLLFIIGQLGIAGGEQRSLTLLCNELSGRGYFDITIAVLESDAPVYPLDARIRFVNLLDYKKSRIARFFYLLNMIRRYGYSLIVGYGMTARLFTGVIGCLFRTPLVFCERRHPYYKNYPLLKGLVQAAGIVLLRGKNIVFQSQAVVGCYKKIKNYTIIPNMLEAEALPDINNWPVRKNLIISAGRHVPEKDFSLLIRAFAAAYNVCPEFKLEIYGEGKLKEDADNLIQSLGTGEYIALKQPDLDIFEHMNNAKIYVCSSNREGYPNALLEAMAMGMACISTNCSGSVEELIEDGVNGLLTPVGDTDAMAEALLKLMKDDNFAAKLGERAAAVRESNAKEKIVGQWVEFFEEVMGG